MPIIWLVTDYYFYYKTHVLTIGFYCFIIYISDTYVPPLADFNVLHLILDGLYVEMIILLNTICIDQYCGYI